MQQKIEHWRLMLAGHALDDELVDLGEGRAAKVWMVVVVGVDDQCSFNA